MTLQIQLFAHLLKYDTTQGRFDELLKLKKVDSVNGKFVKVSAEWPWTNWLGYWRNCSWSNCFFAKKDAAEKHLKGGAKKVVITAPGGNDVRTIVFNTNHDVLMVLKQLSQALMYYKLFGSNG